jgi:predicted XRE-type DNA-binding protein
MDNQFEISEAKGPSIFHDLGFEDADELFEKAKLVRRIQQIMEERNLTQAQLGGLIGMPQAEVSRLLRGRLDRFTFDRLFKALKTLGVRVVIMLPEDVATTPTR